MSKIVFQSATELTTQIAEKNVSAEEVLDAHLEHIAKHNSSINAIVTLDEEGARKRAREIDSVSAGTNLPLLGIPVTIKDAFMVNGMRTTGGYLPLADYIPEEDSTVATRLRAAGAIIIGKTNVPILSSDTQTDNEIFGRTNNPWNVEHTPGGSSGGSAAAVASGMSVLDIGSDVAGSVRIPAHYCGVYSLKPTQFRVSTAGHIPPIPDTQQGVRGLSVAGPITRSVDDLELAIRVIAGADKRQIEIPPVPLIDAVAPPLNELRVAWSDRLGHVPITGDTERVLKTVIEKLQKHGSTTSQRLPEGFKFPELWEAFGTLYWAQVGTRMTPEEDEQVALEAGFVPDSDDAFSRGAGKAVHATMRVYAQANLAREQHIMALDQLLEEWDVFICPVVATPAIPHIPHMSKIIVAGQEINYFERGTYYCIPFNFTGHPVVVIPAGYASDGLPIGIQIVGKRWDEMRLLAMAKRVDAVIKAYRHPTGF